MTINQVVFLGAANPHTKRLADILDFYRGQGCRFDEWIGFVDDAKTGEFGGLPILGSLDIIPDLVASGHVFVNTISGSTVGRYETSMKVIDAGGSFVDFIHPLTEPFKHGVGTYVQEEVCIQADVEVGDNCAIHARTFIAHECQIGNSVFMVACNLMGRVIVGDGAYIGPGATIVKDVKIGKWSTVGAGAVILHDVPDYAVMVGSPARKIKENPRTYDSGALT